MSISAGRASAIRVRAEAQGTVEGDGVSLAFGYWPGREQPIVAIHGLSGSYPHFVGVAERLSGRRPLLAPDLRGRGDSDKPARPFGVEQHARDVAAAMRAFGLEGCIVVGHSMGAYIGAELAAEWPELVRGLVLLDGGLPPDLPPNLPLQQILETLLAPSMRRLRATYPSYDAYLDYWRSQPTFRADEWSPWIEAWLHYDIGGRPPELRAKADERAVRADFEALAPKAPALARLGKVRCPVLAIRAEHGPIAGQPPIMPEAVMAELRVIFPSLEEHLLPGTTHYTVVLAEPAASRVADLLVAFAERLGA